MKKIIACSVLLLFASLHLLAGQVPPKDSIIVTKLWDKAPHNAFPDLFKFKKYFYITFREASHHVSNENDGKVRIMRSKDLKKWETVTLLQLPDTDIREARLSETPDGKYW